MADQFEKQIRDEPEQSTRASQRQLDAIKSVLGYRNGRRFVYDLLGVCHFGRSSFSGEAALTASALSGKQLVGEWVMDMLSAIHPEAYGLMIKEAKEDYDNDNRERAASVASSDSNTVIASDSGNQPA